MEAQEPYSTKTSRSQPEFKKRLGSCILIINLIPICSHRIKALDADIITLSPLASYGAVSKLP